MAFDWSGNSYPKYDPKKEGYGSAREWASSFNVRMGFKDFKDAQEWKRKSTRSWATDWQVINDIAELHKFVGTADKCTACGFDKSAHTFIDEKSIWAEVKRAFKKAATKCHPDICKQNGMTELQAKEKFQDVQAAFAMLQDIYTSQNRLN